MSYEFDCEGCGVHVVQFGGEPHPENVLCCECRFVEGIDDEQSKREAAEFFRRKREQAGGAT